VDYPNDDHVPAPAKPSTRAEKITAWINRRPRPGGFKCGLTTFRGYVFLASY
jgi:hypothetical protein